jgi:hypothetical protein
MSKATPDSKEFQTEAKDIYAVYNRNADRFFDAVEKTVPQYHQTMTNLEHAYITAWKNIIESVISMQHEFATKLGTNMNVPHSVAKMVNDASEEMINTHTVQNKAVIAAIDATHQSINTFNETAKSFTALTHNAMQNWLSVFTPTRK